MSNKAKIREEARKLNPIDDAMFIQMAEDKAFCQEILRVILDDPALLVLEAVSQYVATNRQGRSAVLDAKCLLGDGRIVGVEVQKADDDDHQKRVRYNGALLTTNILNPGTKFQDVPDVVFVFISRFDIFHDGYAIYHVQRVVAETGRVVHNGFEEIYVNANAKDGSAVSELMSVFSEDDAYSKRFPVTSGMKRRLKLTEEGGRHMTATLKKMMDEEREEGRMEGRNSVNRLTSFLLSSGRMEDLKRSLEDSDYQSLLMQELFPQWGE